MDEGIKKNMLHLVILLILVIALLGVLMLTGLLACSSVPGGCDAYYFMKAALNPQRPTGPMILVVYGDSGMGNPDALLSVLNERDILNAQARSMHIDKITQGNIRDFDLVIVEHAKKICTSKLRLFQYYVSSGGRLVWTADSGTELCGGDYTGGRTSETDRLLLESERKENGKPIPIGPWARRDANFQVSFDEFLGVNYRGNYCEFARCNPKEMSGTIEIVNSEHKLSYGLSPSIPYYGDFAVVERSKDEETRLVATIDYGTSLLGKASGQPWLEGGKTYNFGKDLPFIVSTQVGERVAYYAVPLESFVIGQPGKNKALLEQMYQGMLYK
ncbi:MAG TPA: hypothetical protein HA254_01680 [Candidatus Diapherotrites archaeon]|uniref:ThuA domain-containing protein n=1 Tax=Candidatus Iainarchaeum sp. TaxID=3101447 RepID=A0A7J4IUZ2_9ARCH|nr:hypothetical protein [Candidatus Diapherotrites archaeon]